MSVGPAYVSSRGDVIPLSSLAAALGPRRRACLVLSPFLCLTAVLEVPPVPRHQLRSLVRYRLSTLFPGPPQEAAFGFVELTHSPTRHVLAFAMDREAARRLGGEHSGHVLLPAALVLRRAAAVDRCEMARLDTPDATITIRLPAGASPELEVSPSERGASLELCIPRTRASSTQLSLLARALRGSLPEARRLFREPRPSFAATRVLLPLAIAAGTAWYHFADATRAREASLVTLRQDHDNRQVAEKQIESRVKHVEELQEELSVLSASRVPSPYSFLEQLDVAAEEGARVSDLTMSGSTFEVRGLTPDAWALVRALQSLPGILAAQLLESAPLDDGSERFVIRGTYASR